MTALRRRVAEMQDELRQLEAAETERRQTEHERDATLIALRESEACFGELAELLPGIVLELNEQSIVTSVNRSIKRDKPQVEYERGY